MSETKIPKNSKLFPPTSTSTSTSSTSTSMPLLVVTGFPCSGKSFRVNQLIEWFQSENGGRLHFPNHSSTTIKVVSDESLGISKGLYSDSGEEKRIRAMYLSALERDLDKENILVVDATNSIKGQRYQFYCIARSLGTPHAMLQVCCRPDETSCWNSQRPEGQGYTAEALEDLISRYEEPNSFNRWDSPLFTVVSEDAEIPHEIAIEIFKSLLERKCKAPNLSTCVTPLRTSSVQGNDAIVRNLCDQIWKAKQSNVHTNQITVTLPKNGGTAVIDIGTHPLTMHELKRNSFQFLDWIKGGRLSSYDCMGQDEIAKSFLSYLSDKRRQCM